MDTIYKDVCSLIWNPRCTQQQLDEYNASISRHEKKQKNTGARTLPRHAPRVVTNDLFSKQIGLSNCIASGGNWMGFIVKLTLAFSQVVLP